MHHGGVHPEANTIPAPPPSGRGWGGGWGGGRLSELGTRARMTRQYPPRATCTVSPSSSAPPPAANPASPVDVALALRDQHALPAEIITADSIQIFRGWDIGSAKPTPAEQRGVPHHLIDIINPTDRFSVDTWLGMAERTVADLQARGVTPVVVGGTHLYIKAFMEGLFEGPEPDPELREELRGMDPALRRAELERVDPAAAARIHPNDERRTVRALEVFRLTGAPSASTSASGTPAPRGRIACSSASIGRWRP